MSKRDHVRPRPALSTDQPSRGELNPQPTSNKRKSPAGSEPTSDTSKRSRGPSAARGSNVSGLPGLASVPESVLEADSETIPPARTLLDRSSALAAGGIPSSQATLSKTAPEAPKPAPRQRVVTPLRVSASHQDPACAPLSDTMGQRLRHPSNRGGSLKRSGRSQRSISSNSTTQLDRAGMEEVMKHELHGHVFGHRRFFDEFLESDHNIQNDVRQLILNSPEFAATDLLSFTNDRWAIHDDIALQRKEVDVYAPLARMLNVVGRGAHGNYTSRFPDDQFRESYHPFYDHSNKAALWDFPSDAATSPDLVMSREGKRAHWADMELLVECKSTSENKHRKEAYLQLARYARAVFAHQIYRLRVFGFSLCGSIVNFVCFDRSGLLHSTDIDLSIPAEAHSFVEHLITLLTVDPERFGYDTRYSFRQDDERNTVDTLFKFDDDHDAQVVSELLCYRKCCCGRATCVCALGDDVHKSIWRPEDRDDEGDTLALFEGVFGVCQVKAHNYGQYDTDLKYPGDLEESPYASFFSPPNTTATTSSGSGSQAADPRPSNAPAGSEPTPMPYELRGVRVKSDILMPRGVSLFDAQSPLHLMMAIHDALMGIMAFTQAGKLHCDISAYNLLLINPDKHYGKHGWLKAPNVTLNSEVWSRTAKGTNAPVNSQASTSQATCPRLKRAEELKRGPVCVIHDTEFTVNEDRTEADVHKADRTGTPAFISAQLLEGLWPKQEPVARTFMHDIESLFWVLVWIVAHQSRSKTEWKINAQAEEVIKSLSQNDLKLLGGYKLGLIKQQFWLEETIEKFDNDWSEDLAEVIGDLAQYIFTYFYVGNLKSAQRGSSRRAQAADQISKHEEYMVSPRSTTFVHLFNILNDAISRLEDKYPKIDFRTL
ncbi:hypothetical protein FRC07_010291 [Ceratobasidium sp. 392]|nr:hypothetical protein FRC07_010291 [Ceratobasidium sp. 392]